MVQYEIVSNHNGIRIRIFDAPAYGWRTLFTEKGGSIVRYGNDAEATAGLRIYDSADKTALIEAELEVYLKAAATGRTLDDCGLPSLVRFGEADHFIYVTFNLTEQFVRQSKHHIIGYKDGDPIYSAGWDVIAA